ncbi:MAG: uracil-DNA glycosylase [Patescibacteria group bacterium]|nr:uracil-DNA glycosylase [Patescibacteria group bacterium]
MTKKDNLLKAIKDKIWNLKESPLYDYRKKNNYLPVIGEGNHDAKIIFIGEAPGENEAKTGRPFCGAAGKVLDNLLISEGIKREEVYITNIVKDRPPGNRDPLPEEIDLYSPFLLEQIEIIKPKIIATLGRFSMSFIMNKFDVQGKNDTISKNHEKVFKTKTSFGEIKIIPLYHPAVALYNNSSKKNLEEDFKIFKRIKI